MINNYFKDTVSGVALEPCSTAYVIVLEKAKTSDLYTLNYANTVLKEWIPISFLIEVEIKENGTLIFTDKYNTYTDKVSFFLSQKNAAVRDCYLKGKPCSEAFNQLIYKNDQAQHALMFLSKETIDFVINNPIPGKEFCTYEETVAKKEKYFKKRTKYNHYDPAFFFKELFEKNKFFGPVDFNTTKIFHPMQEKIFATVLSYLGENEKNISILSEDFALFKRVFSLLELLGKEIVPSFVAETKQEIRTFEKKYFKYLAQEADKKESINLIELGIAFTPDDWRNKTNIFNKFIKKLKELEFLYPHTIQVKIKKKDQISEDIYFIKLNTEKDGFIIQKEENAEELSFKSTSNMIPSSWKLIYFRQIEN